MCGIFGIHSSQALEPALLHRMAQSLAHRGPDGYGIHTDAPAAIGAGRLAIIDLSAPAGPLCNETGDIAVAFNGEIYNFAQLRSQLTRAGHHFSTQTDTEVLVHGYEEWGCDLVQRLRGMFAFGIWDAPRRRLFMARDRCGEKPLYFTRCDDDTTLLFASEIKALFQHEALRPAINEEALPYYLTLGYIPPPLTLFAGIRKLAAGEYLLYDGESLHIESYWQPQAAPQQFRGTYDEARQQVQQQVTDAVQSRMVSDVPVGAFLSGGVDSTAVVAIMQQHAAQPVQTFTVGFDFEPGSHGDEKFNVDAHYARQAAAHIGTHHHEITINDAFVPDLLPHLVYQMDEPLAQHSIIQTAYVTALARDQNVPVLLSGDAGDELFLGYSHYTADQTLRWILRLPFMIRQRILKPLFMQIPALQSSVSKLTADDPTRRYLEWMRFMHPDEAAALLRRSITPDAIHAALQETLAPLLQAPQTDHFADRIAYASARLWIPEDSNMRVDKMSMLMSVEARAPLEDHDFVQFALNLPLDYKLRHGDTKAIFKDAVRGWMPDAIINRPKWGFIPPTSDWLRTNLRPLVDTYLAPDYVEAAGMCHPAVVSRLVQEHMTKTGYHLKPLWALLILHVWYALYIDQSLSLDTTLTPRDVVTGSQIQTLIPNANR